MRKPVYAICGHPPKTDFLVKWLLSPFLDSDFVYGTAKFYLHMSHVMLKPVWVSDRV